MLVSRVLFNFLVSLSVFGDEYEISRRIWITAETLFFFLVACVIGGDIMDFSEFARKRQSDHQILHVNSESSWFPLTLIWRTLANLIKAR
jgi:hypothetical protein